MISILHQLWSSWSSGRESEGWMADYWRISDLRSHFILFLLGSAPIQYIELLETVLTARHPSAASGNDSRMAKGNQSKIAGAGYRTNHWSPK